MIDHKKMYEETANWLDDVKMEFNPKAKLGDHVDRPDAVCRDRQGCILKGEGCYSGRADFLTVGQ